MVADAEIICQQSRPAAVYDMKYHLRVAATTTQERTDSSSSSSSSVPVVGEVRVSELISTDISTLESVRVFLPFP